MPRRRSPYNSRAWRKVRRQVLMRDGYRCQIRGPRCTYAATHVDHIRPLADGGSHDPANLRAACLNCNLSRRRTGGRVAPSRDWFGESKAAEAP